MLRFFGIGYDSPTFATAMFDLIPAFTFILVIVFSMEKLDWKANSTQAKSIGTLVSIAGALIITLYKGQAVIKNHPSNKLFPKKHVSSEQFDWTWIIRNYPAELVIVLTRGTLVAMLSIPPSLISVTDPKDLRLGFDVHLIAIALQVRIDTIAVIGFYAVIWGKSQEQAKEECKVYDDSESYSPIVPLLENKRMEE
ncbi:Auxin-induced protein 5NG4 [Glycine soja]|uniref:Auxin-induced protein 5NG4 n=1 Tax=Glycine soja TaxID=3848 RepID=A0A0B2PG95_GLYSO|nr:Auxin-induced protein 5NG4 [Glycine soja]